MAVRTRNKSSSRLSDYLGTGRELLVSDLPTTRDILRFGLLKREEYHLYKRNFTVDMICDEMRDGLISQWQSANGLFQYPVISDSSNIKKNLKFHWEQAVRFSEGKGKKVDMDKFKDKLDLLFDILHCKCQIKLCCESGCGEDCDMECHITCMCPAEKKIPLIELRFIQLQREKVGSKSIQQISSLDSPVTKQQECRILRTSLLRKN